ncbi:MAG: STAS domain-containing protein [Terriglobales bacterium]
MAANPVAPIRKFHLVTTHSADQASVVCSGRITGDSVEELSNEVRRLIPENRVIVVDLSDVDYLDSTGLGVLVGLYISAKKSGKTLKLVKLNDRIAELLRLTKLASVFEGYGEYL